MCVVLGFNVQLIESVCFTGVCVVLGFNVQLIEDVLRYRETIITLVWIVYHVVFDFVFELVAFKG